MTSPAQDFAQPGVLELPPVTVTNYGLSGAGVQMMTGIGLLTSIIGMNRSTTTPALYTLYDGSSNGSPMLAPMSIPAGGSFAHAPCRPGIYFGTGLYLFNTSGSAFFTFTYIPLLLPLK